MKRFLACSNCEAQHGRRYESHMKEALIISSKTNDLCITYSYHQHINIDSEKEIKVAIIYYYKANAHES